MGDVVKLLQGRLPGPDVTPDQLRNRSWWSGAELYVLVDDYDLVHTPSGNPLHALLEFLPQARDVGLHVVLCRRAGGASRTMYEPFMQRIRELATPGLLMSGPRDEGVLLGTLRPSLQPAGRGYLVSRRVGQQLVQVAHRGPLTSSANRFRSRPAPAQVRPELSTFDSSQRHRLSSRIGETLLWNNSSRRDLLRS